ncbi:DUF4407 domain-containing protein [Amycolatopsis sp. NPDC051758]|uniref:DUF4407 domain-containing protein n=1 Tax=Amycolatopsis sp. NPDC051758 TaxID=3363935 RepID=UPI0037B34353
MTDDEADRRPSWEASSSTPEVTGDPVVDEVLHKAGLQAQLGGPPPPDPREFMASFWASKGVNSPAVEGESARMSQDEPSSSLAAGSIDVRLAETVAAIARSAAPDEGRRRRRSRWSWWLARLAGAQPEVLVKAGIEGDRYTAMGGVLLTTAAMAAVSATFALHNAVNFSAVAAAIGGVLWGIAIFNLDRMLIISMTRSRGWWRNAFAAVPRIALALLMGTVISVPLVLRIFEPAIQSEMQIMSAEGIQRSSQTLNAAFPDISALESELSKLKDTVSGMDQPAVATDPDVAAARKDVETAQAAYSAASHEVECELSGTCGTGRPGNGPELRFRQQQADLAKTQLDTAQGRLNTAIDRAESRISEGAASSRAAAQQQLTSVQKRLAERQQQKEQALAAATSAEMGNDGLLTQVEALERLTDSNGAIGYATLLLMVLFMTIEILPVAAKLLSISGSETLYEEVLADEEKMLRQRSADVEKAAEAAAAKTIEKSLESWDRILKSYSDEQMATFLFRAETRKRGERGRRKPSDPEGRLRRVVGGSD